MMQDEEVSSPVMRAVTLLNEMRVAESRALELRKEWNEALEDLDFGELAVYAGITAEWNE